MLSGGEKPAKMINFIAQINVVTMLEGLLLLHNR